MPRVVVVGGGIAGLAAAHALHGMDVVVLESTSQVGGKLRTSEVGGLPVDEGAESFLARVPEALGLARARMWAWLPRYGKTTPPARRGAGPGGLAALFKGPRWNADRPIPPG